MAAVTGDDEDNLVICQMAKHHFDVPRTIARVNNPKNEALFRHLGVDEIISPTRMVLGSIEQDIPVHELLHLATLGESDLEIIEAHLQAGSPAIGRSPRDLSIPEGCSLFAVVRDGVAIAAPAGHGRCAKATRSSRSATAECEAPSTTSSSASPEPRSGRLDPAGGLTELARRRPAGRPSQECQKSLASSQSLDNDR